MSIKTVIKISLYYLVALILLFLVLEAAQRIRYSVIKHDWHWLLYFDKKRTDGEDAGKDFAKRFIRAERPEPGTAINAAQKSVSGSAQVSGSGGAQEPQQKTVSYRYIVCVGGSSTAGVYNDPHHTYPYLLGRLFNSSAAAGRNEEKFAVVNMGLTGEASDAFYNYIGITLDRVDPELVIFYCGYNDIFIKDVNKIYASFTAKLSPVYARMEKYSLLLLTLKEKYIIHKVNQAKSYKGNRRKYDRLEEEFRANMDKSVRFLRQRGIEVVLIPEVLIAGDFAGRSYRDYAEKYSAIPGILEEISKKYGCEYLTFQGYFDRPDRKRYFIDPVHLTDEGNAVLSKLIFDNSAKIRGLIGGI